MEKFWLNFMKIDGERDSTFFFKVSFIDVKMNAWKDVTIIMKSL